MKIKIILICLLLGGCSCNLIAQEYNCYLAGSEIKFSIDTTQVLVKFKGNYSIKKRNNLLKNILIHPLSDKQKSPNNFSAFSFKSNISKSKTEEIIKALNKLPEIEFASPFLIHNRNNNIGMTNEILVKLKSYSDTIYLKSFCIENNLVLSKKPEFKKGNRQSNNFMNFIAILKLPKNNILSCFLIVRKIQDSKLFTYAEPNFIHIKSLVFIPNDPLFPSQWALPKMNVTSAWNTTLGNNTQWWLDKIKVAVIDEGVELNHPDLIANMGFGFDATFGSSTSAQQPYNNSVGKNNPYDGHGTACAGIIAAQHNSIGIAGISTYCQILPVRIAYNFPFTNGIGWMTDDYIAASGINWAYLNGADIISNSWGDDYFETSIMDDAIENACNMGRNGFRVPDFFCGSK